MRTINNQDNILIFADLTSPLMQPRIMMLKELPYNKFILHNANNAIINDSVIEEYKGFTILQHPKIFLLKIRYLYSFFYTLYLLLKLRPKLIVVHWASRLYQNLLLSLWGNRVIVHTMGGDIDDKQDYHGKKKFFVDKLLKSCKVISVKSNFMRFIIQKNNAKIDLTKIVHISWGVSECFLKKSSPQDKIQMQYRLFGREFECLFFSIRAFDPFYRQMEIIKTFLDLFADNPKVGLIVSTSRKREDYYGEIFKKINLNIFLCDIPHFEMQKYILASDCIVSFAKSDGLPQSIMEGLAMDKWILCNNLPNYCELLNQDNAILFDDVDGLSRGYLRILEVKENKPKKHKGIELILNSNLQKQNYLKILKENFNV